MKQGNQVRRSSPAREEQEEVAQRAYELYQARGAEPGHELEDWLEAERDVNNRHGLIHAEG